MEIFRRYLTAWAAAAGVAVIATSCGRDKADEGNTIYQCDEYTVYADSVVQGDFTAKALSPLEIVTDYRSPETSGASPVINFRFSLNSRDNELTGGKSHTALVTPGANDSTVYSFGRIVDEAVDTERANDTLPVNTKWTVRVDMRPVLRAFADKGYYVTPARDTIYADDFKGVWVAGSVEPLTWDFENLYGKHDRRLKDRGDSIYEVTLTLNPATKRNPDPTGWRIDSVDSRFPVYDSEQMLVNAVYNMGISEIVSDIRPDGTYRAGKEWDGVWTRDVSYSIYLALAYLDPVRSMNSLCAKVKNGRIVQDTGTGGAWPVSSDRVVWALAAWEVYKVTGDREWLVEAYEVIRNTIEDDLAVVWDDGFNLMHGEQSYLDWREQTYPKWMQPADIYESMCLGTNVAFVRAFDVLANMSKELGTDGSFYSRKAAQLRQSINDRLWIPNLGYYSEYLYGGVYPLQSQITDNLGQALSIIFDVATPEMASSIISKTPTVSFGTCSVYPQIADVKPYHNNAVWPFVQAYWNLASAKVKNTKALSAGLGSIIRAAALFGTNKELFVATTGDYRGTAVNSDAQLWSCAGNVAMVFRIIAGMEFEPDGIVFHPVIPRSLTGDKSISNFRYRDADLIVAIHGTGDKVASFTIDGRPVSGNKCPADLKGHHQVDIIMANNTIHNNDIEIREQAYIPATPIVDWTTPRQAQIVNNTVGVSYSVYLNGALEDETHVLTYNLYEAPSFTTVAFVPVYDNRWSGFSERPHQYFPPGSLTVIQAEDLVAGGTRFIADKEKAARFVELTRTKNTRLPFTVDAPADGTYFIDVRYANGSGPINTENKCGIRTLLVNGERAGAIVMPQRGIDEWLSTGFSNMLTVKLRKGVNNLSIDYITPYNENMNGEVNTALLDYIRVIRK